MVTIEHIRVKISEAIKQSGMTNSEIARRIGIRHQQISCYVNGQKMPALDTFAKLCAVLDIDANEILCVADYETEDN